MSLLARLPLVTLLAAFAVFSFTLFLTITSGVGISQPINLLFILLLALSIALMFLALNPNNERAALMLWFGAGVWGAAAYLNFQLLGLLQLVVAIVAAASAFWVERESRMASFVGPAVFIVTSVALVILSRFI